MSKKSTKGLMTITSNEELARLRIFEGVIPDTDGYKELWELEKAQRTSEQKATEAELAHLSKRGLWRRFAAWRAGRP